MILALTLGASITSIIHGVFMLFGSLTTAAGTAPGLPATLISSLPVISAILALTGGIIAFNYSKWGALFLFFAAGTCIPAGSDIWLYGGIYFFTAVLCFFLKRPQEYPQDMYGYDYDYADEYDEEENNYIDSARNADRNFHDFNLNLNLEADAEEYVNDYPVQSAEKIENNNLNPSQDFETVLDQQMTQPAKIRRRTSKTCPECGAIVARDDKFCSTCGTPLHVVIDEPAEDLTQPAEQNLNNVLLGNAEEFQEPVQNNNYDNESFYSNENVYQNNFNGGDDMRNNENYRVAVNSGRDDFSGRRTANSNVASYKNFSNSKYARRGKKPRKSAGRKLLSVILLIAAVGGALYFLLGLRKLPPGELPPMVRPEITPAAEETPVTERSNIVAQPVELPAIKENILPDLLPNPNPSVGVLNGNSVHLRAESTTNSASLTQLKKNTRVEVIGSTPGNAGKKTGIWYHVRTGGREGWVFGEYLNVSGANLPDGYSNALLKSLGSNKSELIESLGQPENSTATSLEWSGLSAGMRGDEITRLVLTNKRYELQNGLKTGMSRNDVINILGYPTSTNAPQRTIQYNENNKPGIILQTDRNSIVTRITVNNINN